MATTSAYAVAAGGEAAARRTLLRPRPPPPRLAFLSRTPARGASISLPTGLHRAAAAAEGRTGMGVGSEEEGPAWVELEPIGSDEQLDRALAAAQQRRAPIVLLWTASWCRKCIYLKPKLEKLAAEYYPRILFYCVDVNAVPQKLVNRAGVTKMPSIQTWSDSQKQGEVIGGHKSWLVIDDVRKMIEQEE
ncbi:thioredoxin-like 3-2, chloroplastic [Lolium rigidum]|uniref:thioredoxin-like 3-2, chloroplastic n=1 Tax=Lolium rigidum TaxID=89674 RepID=UPI001F5C4F62|nr:thioredoxin-like 3-2, chloroplastic [Lolium rigidum]